MKHGIKSNPYNRLLTFSIVLILCLVLIFPLFAGCSGTPASNIFLELISLIPVIDHGEDVPVYYTLLDYASVFQDTGITFSSPEELLDKITPKDFSINVIGAGSYITGFSYDLDRSTIRKKYLGYDATNVDAEIQFGQPPSNGVAVIGRFDPQATKNALHNQDEWPSWAKTAYTTEEYNGVTVHSWGSGLETHLSTRYVPPHIDNLGRAKPFALTDRYLFSAASVEAIKLMIDLSQNKASSLADLPEYASIANGLADLNVYAAIIADSTLVDYSVFPITFTTTTLTEEEQVAVMAKVGTGLKNFLTLGSGLGRDERGTYNAIVIYHEDSDTAQENAARLKQHLETDNSIVKNIPWTEIITSTDIRTEGNMLIAKLYVDSYSYWSAWVYMRDNLIFIEK